MRRFIAAAVLAGCTGSLWAQSPLSGPKVPVEAPSLISRGFDGKVVFPEPSPEEAALAFLTLTPDERQRTNAELAARATIIDRFCSTQLDLLTKLGVAFGTDDKTDQANLLIEAMFHLQPLAARGALQDRLRECLSPANAKAFDRTLKEFWDAYCKAPAQGAPQSETRNRFEVMTEANLAMLGKQIEASVGRMLGSGDLVFDLLFKNVPLNPDQRVKLSEMVTDFYRRTKGEANDEENKRLFFMILPILENDAQRRAFMDNIHALDGRPRTKPAGDPAGKPADKPPAAMDDADR